MPRAIDPIDLAVEYRHNTPQALLIHDAGNEHWIPLSQIENLDELYFLSCDPGDIITITIPEWLALEKDLI